MVTANFITAKIFWREGVYNFGERSEINLTIWNSLRRWNPWSFTVSLESKLTFWCYIKITWLDWMLISLWHGCRYCLVRNHDRILLLTPILVKTRSTKFMHSTQKASDIRQKIPYWQRMYVRKYKLGKLCMPFYLNMSQNIKSTARHFKFSRHLDI